MIVNLKAYFTDFYCFFLIQFILTIKIKTFQAFIPFPTVSSGKH